MTTDAMPRILRILHAEDLPADARLVLWALRDMPCRIEHLRVADGAAMRKAITDFRPDIILSDYHMPGFGGDEALSIARELAPDIPFVFVSGTMGEQVAIDAFQQGAVDYVLKDNLRRLPSSIERALRLVRGRVEGERMQRALAASEARFRAIVESSKDWIWECDLQARVIYSNDAVEQVLGRHPSELCGTDAGVYMTPDARREVEERLPLHAQAGTGWRDWRLAWLHRDGSVRILESTGSPLYDDDGVHIGFRGVNADITGRLRYEAKILALAKIHAVLAGLAQAVLNAPDRQRMLEEACRVIVETGGFRVAGIGEVRGGALHVIATAGDEAFTRNVAPREPMSLDDASPYRNHPGIRAFREGRRLAISDFENGDVPATLRDQMLATGVRSQVALPIGNPAWGLLGMYSDRKLDYDDEEIALLERLAQEIDHAVEYLGKRERAHYLAYHHPSTGLPNAAAFHLRLPQLLGQPIAFVALEVPRLGHLASTRGRRFVDRLLRAFGDFLQRPGVLVGHDEGARFLLAFATDGTTADASGRLDLLLDEIEASPFSIDDEVLHLPARAGLVVAAADDTDGETLEARATTALARAAESDLRACLYGEDMRRQAMRELQLERDLHHALERKEFELHYQPKFNARSGTLAGAEALLRWRHPTEGLVSPVEFIPLLERTGLIVPVGLWVTRQALTQGMAWRERHDPAFRIAVNVSARELRHRTFVEDREALLVPDATRQVIDIEVTESLLMDDLERYIPLLQAMRRLGCRVAIDDFGTGYSSLNYLVRLPIDTIKIDRSFVAQLADSPETVSLITNVIALAHSLGLDVVAEGVESEEQAKLLHLLRCDALQGHLRGRAKPAAEFESEFMAGAIQQAS